MSSLTGSERTLVAVGTAKETSMFLAVRAGAPRRVVLTGSSNATLGRLSGLGGSAGTPPRAPGALGLISLVGAGFSTVGVRPDVAGCSFSCASGEVWAGAGAGAAFVTVGSPRPASGAAAGLGCGCRSSVAAPWPSPLAGAPWALKYSAHVSSTEFGSAVYCSYISSSSQSLAPKSASVGALVDDWSGTMATVAFFLIRTTRRFTRLWPAPARFSRRYLGYPRL